MLARGGARYWMPAQRAMSMKFSPPTTLLAKRSANDVPYAAAGMRRAIVRSTSRSRPNTACARSSCCRARPTSPYAGTLLRKHPPMDP